MPVVWLTAHDVGESHQTTVLSDSRLLLQCRMPALRAMPRGSG